LAGHEVYSPEFAITKLEKHKLEILKKSKLSSEEFDELKLRLKKNVGFVSFSEYSEYIPGAASLISRHLKDVDFVVLALKLGAFIVSDDKKFKKQSEIRVFNKSELSELF
jgi:predicted nucleic acid-binding protein